MGGMIIVSQDRTQIFKEINLIEISYAYITLSDNSGSHIIGRYDSPEQAMEVMEDMLKHYHFCADIYYMPERCPVMSPLKNDRID